jgi:hypothetical protein
MSGQERLKGLPVLKNRAIAQKLGSVMFASLMVLTAGVAVGAAPASATSCDSTLHRDGIKFRASATCGDIDGDHTVRAWLIRVNEPDYFSSWFRVENTRHYTNWVTCPSGCDDGIQIREI